MPTDSIDDRADLRKVFIGNFQGTYVRPGNSWDLKNCQQEPGESLCDYIRRFSKQCNSLHGVVDADLISAFLSGMHCKTLVHKRTLMGRKSRPDGKSLTPTAEGKPEVASFSARSTSSSSRAMRLLADASTS